MRWMVVLGLLLVAGCSSAERMHYQAQSTGVGYDTVKEDKVPGGYRTRGVYDSSKVRTGEISPDEVRWRTLWNGLETAQKDGYDLATIAGPAGTTVKREVTYRSSGNTVTTAEWPGFVYVIRGYKSADSPPANARPIAALMDAANQRAFAAKPATK